LTIIYTIGYGSRSVEEFLHLLDMHGLEVLVDIRRRPYSKAERFRGEVMRQWLKKHGIDYLWMGEKLGGYRKGGYLKYTESEAFKDGVEELLRLASTKKLCVMCLEVSPLGCHRRYLSQYLSSRGVEVIHIISRKKTRRTVEPCNAL